MNDRVASGSGDASVHLEDLVERELRAFPDGGKGELEGRRAAKGDRFPSLLRPLLKGGEVVGPVGGQDDLAEFVGSLFELLQFGNDFLNRSTGEDPVDGTTNGSDERVRRQCGLELVRVSSELVQRRVDGFEGGGGFEFGEAGFEGTKALRWDVVCCEAGLVGCGTVEGEGGEREVGAELAVETGEDKVGADVGEETDLGLWRKRDEYGRRREARTKGRASGMAI